MGIQQDGGQEASHVASVEKGSSSSTIWTAVPAMLSLVALGLSPAGTRRATLRLASVAVTLLDI